MGEAVADGVGLIGYTAWGCISVASAGMGETKKRCDHIYEDEVSRAIHHAGNPE